MINNYLKINRKRHAYSRAIDRLLIQEQAEKAAALLPRYKMLQAAEKELLNEIKSKKMCEIHNEDAVQKEQKPANEPKFKVGDWIIFVESHNSVYQVERIDNYRYYLRHCLGGTLSVHFDNELIRQWTIQDAKPGDVLVASDGSIFLFAAVVDCACKYYVALSTDNYVKINKKEKGGYWETSRGVKPATKEQRDLLFQKMREAGYEWLEETHKLKKKEQKPAEDWIENRKKECPYRKTDGCERYADVISECTGACSWVVDYPKLKEIQDKQEQKPVLCAQNGDFQKENYRSAVAFAWFVWEKGYIGETVVKWID